MARTNEDVKRLITVEEFAARVSICRANVFNRLRTGEIESVKIGRSRRIPAEEVDRYIERLRRQQGAPAWPA